MESKTIRTIRTQVYQIIKDEICSGSFSPGQWLQEAELAAQLSVSRSPIREALRQLTAEGLVVEYPNKGVYVKEFTPRDIEEIFELRLLMENHAISRLKDHLTKSGADLLLTCLSELEAAYKKADLPLYTQIDERLHSLIIFLSENSLLISNYDRMLSMVKRFRIYSLHSQKRFDESIEEHRGIIQCILAADYAGAQNINHLHLKLAHEKILEYLAQHEITSEGDAAVPLPEKPM